MDDDDDRDPKDPSPAQIRAMCAEIRRGWSAARLAKHDERVEFDVPVIVIEQLSTN